MASKLIRLEVLVFVCLGTSSSFLIPDGIQKVNTKYGDIIGFIDNVNFDSQTYQVRKFLGIPYAEPPVGNLRFKKPIMKRNLSSPFKAQQYGSICPQHNLFKLDVNMSENCLFLNIFTPLSTGIGDIPKPVMVWVHGGGFFSGSANLFAGDVISAFNDVIVVTLNYRLGALGFFSTHDDNAKGNYGLWDQHLAFRWVYENIGDFGGDNANMTIFGESAGSSSVVYQMLYPGNEGVIKRVIAESGTIAAWGVSNGIANYQMSMKFARALGCNETSHSKLVACLQQQTEADIISSALAHLDFKDVNNSWVPVYDGEFVPSKTNTILNELTETNLQQKYHSFHSFDLMIGANNYDGLVYFSAMLQYFPPTENGSKYDVFGEHLFDFFMPRSLEAWLGETPTPLALKLTEGEYTTWSDPTNITMRMKSAAKFYTDYALIAPNIKTATAHVNNQSNTFVYQFSNAPPVTFVDVPQPLAGNYVASHGDEVAFVFGFHIIWYGQMIPTNRLTQEYIKLSKAMMTMWTNFARSGNPNYPRSVQPLYDVTWPEFDRSGENYLEINDKMSPSSAKQRLDPRAVEFWNNILPKVQALTKSN